VGEPLRDFPIKGERVAADLFAIETLKEYCVVRDACVVGQRKSTDLSDHSACSSAFRVGVKSPRQRPRIGLGKLAGNAPLRQHVLQPFEGVLPMRVYPACGGYFQRFVESPPQGVLLQVWREPHDGAM